MRSRTGRWKHCPVFLPFQLLGEAGQGDAGLVGDAAAHDPQRQRQLVAGRRDPTEHLRLAVIVLVSRVRATALPGEGTAG
jgi:hypothetical protein